MKTIYVLSKDTYGGAFMAGSRTLSDRRNDADRATEYETRLEAATAAAELGSDYTVEKLFTDGTFYWTGSSGELVGGDVVLARSFIRALRMPHIYNHDAILPDFLAHAQVQRTANGGATNPYLSHLLAEAEEKRQGKGLAPFATIGDALDFMEDGCSIELLS